MQVKCLPGRIVALQEGENPIPLLTTDPHNGSILGSKMNNHEIKIVKLGFEYGSGSDDIKKPRSKARKIAESNNIANWNELFFLGIEKGEEVKKNMSWATTGYGFDYDPVTDSYSSFWWQMSPDSFDTDVWKTLEQGGYRTVKEAITGLDIRLDKVRQAYNQSRRLANAQH